MGFIKRKYQKYKAGMYNTFSNTHFSIMPVRYVFVTDMDFGEISDIVAQEVGFIRNIRRYNVLMGYCKGNRLTIFKVSFSAKFLIMMRPFQAYMKRNENSTIISGTFRFSTSTMILMVVWMLNDSIHLIERLNSPMPTNVIGHLISLFVFPIFLARMIWKDKKTQTMVVKFMEEKLNARWIKKNKDEYTNNKQGNIIKNKK